MVRRRNNIVMVRLPTPKRATLSNGRAFMANYERRKKCDCPPNIREEGIKKELEEEDRAVVECKWVREK